MDKKWWQKSVVYQIYPRSFCDSNGDGVGDINGIRSKIGYLKELGIDVIWLSPVYRSPNDDNGYDISDYYDISPEFGTMEEMKALLSECRENGIRIVMDLVVNHTSDEHPWFIGSASKKDSPYRDYYIWRDGRDGGPPNDLTSAFGGSAWEYSEQTGQYYLHFFSKKQPDLNWENEAVRRKIWEMMNFWIDLGIGGFRMDVIDLIGKEPDRKIRENGPKLHEYLREMNEKTFGNRDLLTVGECWGATPHDGYLYSAPERRELSMIFQFEQVGLDQQPGMQKWDIRPLDLRALKAVFTKWQTEMEGKGWNSLFLSNHDLPRIVSRWGNDGKYRVESAKMLATMLHGMKGTVYVYQGEELGMTNIPIDGPEDISDIEAKNMYEERKAQGCPEEEILNSLRARARDNARTPMQWDDSAQAGFTPGTPWYRVNPNYTRINARREMADPDSVFHHYQKLIRLRRENDIMVYGVYEQVDGGDETVFAYTRTLGESKWLIVCNFYEKMADFCGKGKGKILLSNYRDSGTDLERLVLRPYEAVIYSLS